MANKLVKLRTSKRNAEPAQSAQHPTKRGPGRPRGSKNRPRQLPADSPYILVADYCRVRLISETTFYRKHKAELEIVRFGDLNLITKASAAARDQKQVQPPQAAA